MKKKPLKHMDVYELFKLRESGSIYMILNFSKSGVRIYNFRSKEFKTVQIDTEVYPIY